MSETRDTGVRFEPEDRPPLLLTIGLGTQFAIIVVTGIVLTPAIVVRAGGGSEAFLVWAAFAALVVSGLTTILQARRIGPFGAGYILVMGTSGAFIAVCVTALAEGGPGMLADTRLPVIPGPVHAGEASVDPAPDPDAGGDRDRHHDDSGDRHAHRVRHAGGCS